MAFSSVFHIILLQIDLYDEERRDREQFSGIADSKAGCFSQMMKDTFFDVARSCLQNSYKKRVPIEKVIRYLCVVICIQH